MAGPDFRPADRSLLCMRKRYAYVTVIASDQTSPLGALSPFQPFWTLISNGTGNVSELQLIELHNCSTPSEPSSFGLRCLAPVNFANTTAAANTTFQQCTVDDSFSWSAIFICSTPVITVSRYRSGFSIVHHLITYLSGSNRTFDCYSTINPEATSTALSLLVSEHTGSTSDTRVSLHSSSARTTTAPSPLLSFTACTNGKVGVFCNQTFDLCIVLQPCKNNGNCSTTNSSFYTCSCPRWKFIGIHCEIDIRPCQPNTCFNNAHCNETSPTSFVCQCQARLRGQTLWTVDELLSEYHLSKHGPMSTESVEFHLRMRDNLLFRSLLSRKEFRTGGQTDRITILCLHCNPRNQLLVRLYHCHGCVEICLQNRSCLSRSEASRKDEKD